MSLFAFKKLDKNKVSEKVERIRVDDICYFYTEGKRARPVARLQDGSEYYIADQYEMIKQGLEELCGFQPADRCISVNVKHADYYETEYDRIFFQHKEKEPTFVIVARKYAAVLKDIFAKCGVRIKQ